MPPPGRPGIQPRECPSDAQSVRCLPCSGRPGPGHHPVQRGRDRGPPGAWPGSRQRIPDAAQLRRIRMRRPVQQLLPASAPHLSPPPHHLFSCPFLPPLPPSSLLLLPFPSSPPPLPLSLPPPLPL